jgi:CelD/BcsL family acetyltransferase involved in cellulose biosynthesis
LSEQGSLRLLIARSADEKNSLLDCMIASKRAQLQRMGAEDIFARRGVEDFYRQCAAIEEPSITHLSGLLLNDEILATNMGFTDTDCFCGVLTSFARGPWARYSCGHLHLQMLLRWTAEAGLRNFDFGIGDEEYKKFWCDRDIALRNRRGPASLAGHTHDLFYRLRGRMRGMLRPRNPAKNPAR